MRKSLYEITGQALEIYSELEESGGELTPEMEEALVITQTEMQSKGVAYLEVIKDRTAFVGNIDAEIKRLQVMKKANTSLINRLKSNLLDAVNAFGDIELGLTTITTRKSKAVEVEDINSLPNEYKTIKVTEAADKKAIKEAIERGTEIKGCSIVENKNLRIK